MMSAESGTRFELCHDMARMRKDTEIIFREFGSTSICDVEKTWSISSGDNIVF